MFYCISSRIKKKPPPPPNPVKFKLPQRMGEYGLSNMVEDGVHMMGKDGVPWIGCATEYQGWNALSTLDRGVDGVPLLPWMGTEYLGWD